MQYNKQYVTNLKCFKGCNTHKELISCIRITARSKPPESRAGGVPVFLFLFYFFGGGGIFVERPVTLCPRKNCPF